MVHSEEREQIMEKRSSLFRERKRSSRIPHKALFIGAALLLILFLVFMVPTFWNQTKENSTIPSEKSGKTPGWTPGKTPSQDTKIAPSIMINSPENIIYNTSTPPLDFVVSGSKLDRVNLSVDGGPEISIPHDGTIAKISFAKLNPLLIENGKYIAKNKTFSLDDLKLDDYIIETRIKIISGENVSIDIRWDVGGNYYSMQTGGTYGKLLLNKVNGKSLTNLFTSKLPKIDPVSWHVWKIAVTGKRIQGFIDDIMYIDYTDGAVSNLNGGFRIRLQNANVEYDYVNVYKSLSSGSHEMTIFAKNIAGNASSRIVHFTVNNDMENQDMIGIIGTPLAKNGFEINVKSISPSDFYTSAWIEVKNKGDTTKSFKLSPNPVIIDNNGNQYETVKVARSAEITQNDLYPGAKREGAIFFDKFKEGAKVQKLILFINGGRFEFTLDEKK